MPIKAFALCPQLQTHTYQLNLLLSLTAFVFGGALKVNHSVGFEFGSDCCIGPHDTFSWGAALPPHHTSQGDKSPVTFTANLKADLSRWGSRKGPWVWLSKGSVYMAIGLCPCNLRVLRNAGRHHITSSSFPTSHISLMLDI